MKHILIAFCLTITVAQTRAQYTISGTIEDAQTGEQLVSANVYEASSLTGVATNFYGFYSLKLPEGPVNLVFSYIGYEQVQMSFSLNKDTVINMRLNQNLTIEEVTITDKGPAATVRSTQMSMVEIPMIQTKQLPVLFGEVDVIKTIQLLPGVQSGTEGLSGLYVRGGGPSENLILLDGVPVYNVSHLFGFFSVFNSDAIHSFNLYKGGFPARYGGRLSSVLDIKMKEGNMNEVKGTGSIGIISSNLTVEGPLIKDKASFIISGRRSYIDVLTWPLQKWYSRSQGNDYDELAGYYLYDFNAKINYRYSDKSRLYLSMYTGKDKAYAKYKYESEYSKDDDDMEFWWGNITAAMRWNYIISNNLFCNVTGTYSRYKMLVGNEYSYSNLDPVENRFVGSSYYFDYSSSIQDLTAKIDFDWIPSPKHSIRFGINNTLHFFKPGVTVEFAEDEFSEPVDTVYGNEDMFANELSAYIEDEINITRKLKANIGIRSSLFDVQSTTYHSFEPRVSVRYLINDKLSVKAAYSYMQQYIHLLTNSGASLPTDLWVPVTENIKPLKSFQVAGGFALNLNHGFEFTAEGYYKELKNVIEYKEGASYFDFEGGWEENILSGMGWTYGMELFLQRRVGNTKGWIGYTLSWANRQFKWAEDPADNISGGKVFPFKYDRRHDLTMAATHTFFGNTDVGLTWVFGSGYPFSFGNQQFVPLTNFFIDDYYYNGYGQGNYTDHVEYVEKRNNYRLPVYHRMDLAVTRHKDKKKTHRAFTFGVYNVYNRKNALFVFKQNDYSYDNYGNERITVKMKQITFFPFLPYVRYSVTF